MGKKRSVEVAVPMSSGFGSPSESPWAGTGPAEDAGAQATVHPGDAEVTETMHRFAHQGITHALDDYHPRPDQKGKGW